MIASYLYDAWGTTTVLSADGSESTNQTFIGNTNPIRYRGYYYDPETSLYYTPGRYYDPEIGRWISLDDVSVLNYTRDMINGLNLYAYCFNNPVNASDHGGDMPDWLKWTLGIVIIIGAVALSVVTAGLAAPIAADVGGGLFGAIVGGAVAGAIGGAIVGFGISVGMQGISNGFNNIDWSQVGKSTLSGAISGFVAGGVFGGIKHVMSAAKVANSLSGLSQATSNFDEAALVLKNTPMAFLKGGGMATDHIAAQAAYRVASFSLSRAQTVYNIVKPSMTALYMGGQFGLKQGLGYMINGWL